MNSCWLESYFSACLEHQEALVERDVSSIEDMREKLGSNHLLARSCFK